MASTSSSTSVRSKRRVTLLRPPSREDVYDGSIRLCYHRLVAPRWTAWTNGNPGRRFYGCRFYYQDGGCGYFAWHDDGFGERANVVIKQLLDDIDKLYDENTKIRKDDDGRRMFEELDAIHGELRNLKCRSKIGGSDVKFKIVVAALIMTWVWIIVM